MRENVIEMHGVNKSFGKELVIEDLSFSVKSGEIVGLLGPNGAGKTTTIRLLNGVIKSDSGRISVFGKDPIKSGAAVRKSSGVLTESAGLYGEMTAEENLWFFSKLYDIRNPKQRIADLIKDFGLAEYKARKVETYSTGMKKRLGIAKALIHQPELLFLDEPTTGLDPEGARSLLGYIREMNSKHGVTILLCTHLLRQVQDLCHSYVFLDEGRLLETGTLVELEKRYLGDFILKVETDLQVKDRFDEYKVEEVQPGFVFFRLREKTEVSPLLTKLLAKAPVYSAEIIGRDLETLYFNVRRRNS